MLPKQQAQAEAWRLFIFSGSLTWFRKPRLASFTSTSEVETNSSPRRVTTELAAPKAYRPLPLRDPDHLVQGDVLAKLFHVACRPRHITLGVAFGEGLASILLFSAFRQRDLYLGATLFEVQLQGNDRE